MSTLDLIELVAGDLPGYRLDRRGRGTAVFVPESGGLDLEVSEVVERRFLGRTRVARFGATFDSPGWGDQTIRVRHTGGMRRSGVSLSPSPADAVLADLLQADGVFVEAATTLDFKGYDIAIDEGSCRATVELIGAALVAIALPPVRSYVRLYADQRDALLMSLAAIGRVVSVSPADPRC